MMMIEEGLIRPSDPVQKYVPELADMQVAVLKDPADQDISPLLVDPRNPPAHRLVPAKTPITIHHLLTHTAGLMTGGLGTALAGRGKEYRGTLASYVPALGEVALDFQPGSRWAYSGAHALDVVARIIEIVSATPFDEFVQSRIFDPLEMNDTHYNVPPSKASRRVVIHDRDMPGAGRKTTLGFLRSLEHCDGLSPLPADARQRRRNVRPPSARPAHRRDDDQQSGGRPIRQLPEKGRPGLGQGYAVGVVLDPIAADSRRSAGAFGSGGAFGTVSWSDPAEEIAGVIMLQQPYRRAIYDFENAVRQAIID